MLDDRAKTGVDDRLFPFTVSDVAAQSGVAPSAIRFYENHGLIVGVRTPGNQRRFSADAACRVKVARVAQGIGLSIAQIAELLAQLPAEPQEPDWVRLYGALAGEVRRRIAKLDAQLRALPSAGPLCDCPARTTG